MYISIKKDYMHMRKLLIKGGYGEHGRSCFLVEYGSQGHFYMVDCGIMDTDPDPYPHVSKEELEKADYLFLTHSHKDHSGAFDTFVKNGFHGKLICSKMTAILSKINYTNCIYLSIDNESIDKLIWNDNNLIVSFGRSGHSPGGLWYRIKDIQGTCFFSGDYQEDAMFYASDTIKGQIADIAILDEAHDSCIDNAKALREKIVMQVEEQLQNKKSVIFPVPHYGRGVEMYLLMKQSFPHVNIKVDSGFVECLEKILSEPIWYKKEVYETIYQELPKLRSQAINLSKGNDEIDYDIFFLDDTHIQKPYNEVFVKKEVEKDSVLFVTGRIKKGCYPEQALQEGKAYRLLYPHHQSKRDLERMIQNNKFKIVLPFHNDKKEILF